MRLEKAQRAVDGYSKVIEQCKILKAAIDAKCADVKIPIDPQKDLRVLEAARRVFKRDVKEITYEMYKQAVQEMALITNDQIPKIGE